MVKVVQGVQGRDAIRRDARHTLFVEGEGAAGFDVSVLQKLLHDIITVEPLGPSFSVKAVAQALRPHHADYYFLVDRDHQDDAFVEQTWRKFPDPNTQNLLVWRRRELESYFLDSAYLGMLSTADKENPRRVRTPEQIDGIVQREAARRIYLDAANQVIVEVREENKDVWIELFHGPEGLDTAAKARRSLVERPEFAKKRRQLGGLTSSERLGRRFDEVLNELMDGARAPEIGRGTWMARVGAKPIWKTVANQCFQVLDRDGGALQGAEKARQVALALVSKPLEEQPADFRELHRLVTARVRS
jgi:hypothetical protein